MTDFIERKERFRAAFWADPDRVARAQRAGIRTRRNPRLAPIPPRTPTQACEDFDTAEAAIEREQQRNHR